MDFFFQLSSTRALGMTTRINFSACFVILASLLLGGCGRNRERPLDRTPLIPAEKLKETDVLPYAAAQITPGRNYVYCATFQIAWEEMQTTLSSGPIKLKDEPEMAVMLNQNPFDRANLSAESYLAMGGRIDQGIVKKIRQTMTDKFPDATLTVPEPTKDAELYAYAYLAKSAQFKEAFDRLDEPLRFRSAENTVKVAAFGTESFNELSPRGRSLCKQVSILDYQNDDDFIISLNTTSKVDQIIVAKIKPEASLQATIDAVEERIKNSTVPEYEQEPQMGECLMIPVISFGVERTYRELAGIFLLNKGWEQYFIAEPRQGIRFRLDEWGAKLESSGSLEGCKCEKPLKLRRLIFDKPFLIYFKEKSKTTPYFAIWSETPDILEQVK
jgi:hypothetical protein